MLINAHDHPGPALFQGICLCLIALWLFLGANRKPEAEPEEPPEAAYKPMEPADAAALVVVLLIIAGFVSYFVVKGVTA